MKTYEKPILVLLEPVPQTDLALTVGGSDTNIGGDNDVEL